MFIEKSDKIDLDTKSRLDIQSEQLESKCRYKADAHRASTANWTKAHYFFSIPLVILSTVIGLFAFKKIFDNNETVIGILAIIVAILSALLTFLNPSEKARIHYNASVEYGILKEKVKQLRNIELLKIDTLNEYFLKINELTEQKHRLDKGSPVVKPLSPKAMEGMKRLRTMIYGSRGKKHRSKAR